MSIIKKFKGVKSLFAGLVAASLLLGLVPAVAANAAEPVTASASATISPTPAKAKANELKSLQKQAKQLNGGTSVSIPKGVDRVGYLKGFISAAKATQKTQTDATATTASTTTADGDVLNRLKAAGAGDGWTTTVDWQKCLATVNAGPQKFAAHALCSPEDFSSYLSTRNGQAAAEALSTASGAPSTNFLNPANYTPVQATAGFWLPGNSFLYNGKVVTEGGAGNEEPAGSVYWLYTGQGAGSSIYGFKAACGNPQLTAPSSTPKVVYVSPKVVVQVTYSVPPAQNIPVTPVPPVTPTPTCPEGQVINPDYPDHSDVQCKTLKDRDPSQVNWKHEEGTSLVKVTTPASDSGLANTNTEVSSSGVTDTATNTAGSETGVTVSAATPAASGTATDNAAKPNQGGATESNGTNSGTVDSSAIDGATSAQAAAAQAQAQAVAQAQAKAAQAAAAQKAAAVQAQQAAAKAQAQAAANAQAKAQAQQAAAAQAAQSATTAATPSSTASTPATNTN